MAASPRPMASRIPLLVLPMGYARRHRACATRTSTRPARCSSITKSGRADHPRRRGPQHPAPRLHQAAERPRRAGAGRDPRPTCGTRRSPEPLDYKPVLATRYGPDPARRKRAAAMLAAAKRPVIYAGTRHALGPGLAAAEGAGRAAGHSGDHQPRRQVRASPRTIRCRSAPAAGDAARGAALPRQRGRDLRHRLHLHRDQLRRQDAEGARSIIHATLDPMHLNKDLRGGHRAGRRRRADAGRAAGRAGQAGDVATRHGAGGRRDPAIARALAGRVDAEADQQRRAADPLPRAVGPAAYGGRATTPSSPMTPAARATSFPRSGKRTTPLSYIGWGKTTQLGYGLGLAMGAKLATPDKLCINVWGDAAIGFTGMDFETCGARAHPDHVDPAEQLLHGDRAEDHAGHHREVPLAPTSPATTPPWRAPSAAMANA